MSGLTKEQRDNRDQMAAGAAVRVAQRGQTAGIAVDDRSKVKRMLRRVCDIATSMGIEFTVELAPYTEVHIGDGRVRIVPMPRTSR